MIKLLDGKCWMTQNLRISNQTMTSEMSDVLSDYILPSSDINSFASNSNDTSGVYIDDSYGGYYSWFSATAGTGTYSMGVGEDAISSICPKNWKLPKSAIFQILIDKTGSDVGSWSLFNIGLGGYFSSGNTTFTPGSNGYWWSSSVSTSNKHSGALLRATSSKIDIDQSPSVNGGDNVRCVTDE